MTHQYWEINRYIFHASSLVSQEQTEKADHLARFFN